MTILQPLCPSCQTRTVLARVTSGPIGFECLACKHIHQTVADLLSDPMKSVTTNTWLCGQLRAPT
jgi:hypothetical protein